MNQDLNVIPKFCINCGTPFQPGQKYCINCGTKLPTGPWTPKEVVENDKATATKKTPEPSVASPSAEQEMPQSPVAQQPAAPVQTQIPSTPQPQQAAAVTATVVSSPEQPVQKANTETPPPYTPKPQPDVVPSKKSGCGGKTCLGCGCAAVIVFFLILGGLFLWGYNYYKDHQNELVENFGTDFGLSDITDTPQDPETMTWQGKTLRELANENHFPSVIYDQRPKFGQTYASVNETSVVEFSESDMTNTNATYIMTITDKMSGNSMSFNMNSCGCSIYHTFDPNDADLSGYVFVDEGGKRILVSNGAHPVELTLQ